MYRLEKKNNLIWSFGIFFFSGTECPPLRRQMVSRSKGLVMWMSNAPYCSCSITRYAHAPFAQLSEKKVICLYGTLAQMSFHPLCCSPLSTNWIHVWLVCWVCTHRRGPVSCKLFGSISRTTSFKIVMRRSTLTATAISDRYDTHWTLHPYTDLEVEADRHTIYCLFYERWERVERSVAQCWLWCIKHVLLSNKMLNRSLAALAWDSLRFPWSWPGCSNTLIPSLSITWLGLCMCMCVCVVPPYLSVLLLGPQIKFNCTIYVNLYIYS